MAKKLKGDQVFTGQLLRSGDVVFMTNDGSWVTGLENASIGTTSDAVDTLEALAFEGVSKNIVIDVYPIVVVKNEDGQVVPDHIREIIRNAGPSIPYC